MLTQSIPEARELAAFAEQMLEALGAARARAGEVDGLEEECTWLDAAARRVGATCERTKAALAQALPLPEFEAERQALVQASFAAWVEAVEGLCEGIISAVSANNPLMEVLFVHQKFDKVRRGGSAARAFMAEFDKRRAKAYVVRLANEPEYAFLPPLLARVDAARAELACRENPEPLSEEALNALREAVYLACDEVRDALAQARLLAEAAFVTCPTWVTELGLDAKPRKRPTRSVAPPTETE